LFLLVLVRYEEGTGLEVAMVDSEVGLVRDLNVVSEGHTSPEWWFRDIPWNTQERQWLENETENGGDRLVALDVRHQITYPIFINVTSI